MVHFLGDAGRSTRVDDFGPRPAGWTTSTLDGQTSSEDTERMGSEAWDVTLAPPFSTLVIAATDPPWFVTRVGSPLDAARTSAAKLAFAPLIPTAFHAPLSNSHEMSRQPHRPDAILDVARRAFGPESRTLMGLSSTPDVG